ncbi:MAG TPA: hypothetical protein VEG27_02540 [Usitatibacter sp.]|nr:hypothetical protein [Usitatibacter sp.]
MKRLMLLALCALASLGASAQYYPADPGSVSYQGLWWSSPAGSQSGWGINIAHQGNVLFATWFTYDQDGQGLWFVIPDAQLVTPVSVDTYMGDMMDMGMDMGMGGMYGMGGMEGAAMYTGTIYRTTGPAFDAATFDSTKVAAVPVGTATLSFFGSSEGQFDYTVNGNSGSLPITREDFSTPPACAMGGAAPATPNFSDLWWNAPAGSESGWGMNLMQEGDVLFATWFTYDSTGRAAWFVVPDATRAAGTQSWSGAIYHTTGPAYDAKWSNADVQVTPVGAASFVFSGASSGTFTANVDGHMITKAITRQVYANPASVCR